MQQPFQLASMFTDHMVLQQGEPVPVWGSGPEGEIVTVQFRGEIVKAVVQDGCWRVRLQPKDAGGPFELNARLGHEEIVRKDVLVGEVWLAAGQSNMEQPLLFTEGGVAEAESAAAPHLRLFTAPRRPFHDARVPGWHFSGTMSDDAGWHTCTPESALHFSAIGYYFGALLQRSRSVPVGIISCNWGGTPIQAWMSERYLARDPEMGASLEQYRNHVAAQDSEQYEREYAEYVRQMRRMIDERGDIEQRIRSLGLDGYRSWVSANPLAWPPQPLGPKAYFRPCGLYHTMLRTVAPYPIRGVLWYQGESNAVPKEAFLYRKLLASLIENWREDWEKPDLPFLIVQLSAYAPQRGTNGTVWATLRESQETVARTVPRASMVVTIDCGEHDIHPVRKRPVAERLLLAAQSDVYGEEADARGPRYRSMEVEGNKAILSFDQHIRALNGTQERLAGFTICGPDRQFVPAEARMAGDRVEIFQPEIQTPVAVRYAWQNMPEYSLYGRSGLPAAPFRTDDFALEQEGNGTK
ncbi:sialate O-acetylesterase [Paenibacillus allorhizosphaerae]|uniref:Sialate O-acetylesterase domain-containing protein n=1 Tax=Paenibacillus allorhizosphaerae TaxID=2849866 RepID=A0ABM8VFN0_9BACL|nr:sialate O-acetylesterase [Paenibacillus allorhizosphaerae]CAG7635449.1 hypothetical protein PAECIP111802_02142 [Paenibacillus allorhizosphaerae]